MGLIISLLKIFFVGQSGKIITFSVKDFVLPLYILQYKTVPPLSSVISAKPREHEPGPRAAARPGAPAVYTHT